jgi:diguanylate cyclase (GGDEF)-like protein
MVNNHNKISLPHQKDEDDSNLLSEERRVRDRVDIELIYKLCLTLMQTQDVKEICDKILHSILLCLKRIDSGSTLVLDPDTGKLREVSTHVRKEGGNAEVLYSKVVVNETFSSNKAIIMTDICEENDYNLCDEIKTMGVKSIISVPLISKMGTVGVIYLHSVSSEYGFRSDDPFFVSALSTPAALAIENALLHARSKQAENELRKARDKLELDVKNRTSELVIANKKLKELSFTDGLTGLYNHRYLMESLEAEYHRAKRYNHDLALIMIDIDHFKKMNDSFGHPCGDLIIKTIALLLKNNIRTTDLVARYGGDEIAIILLETNKSTALEVAEKLRQKIEEHPVIYRNRTVKVTASIGVAAIPTEGVENWEGLLHAADDALYQAKNAGKNLVAVFEPVKD